MLLVTIEIVPHGQWADRYPIQRLYIANVGGNAHKADYHIWLDKDPTDKTVERPQPDLQIKKFKREKGATELVRQALNKWHAKNNKEAHRAKSRTVKVGAQKTS